MEGAKQALPCFDLVLAALDRMGAVMERDLALLREIKERNDKQTN